MKKHKGIFLHKDLKHAIGMLITYDWCLCYETSLLFFTASGTVDFREFLMAQVKKRSERTSEDEEIKNAFKVINIL